MLVDLFFHFQGGTSQISKLKWKKKRKQEASQTISDILGEVFTTNINVSNFFLSSFFLSLPYYRSHHAAFFRDRKDS